MSRKILWGTFTSTDVAQKIHGWPTTEHPFTCTWPRESAVVCLFFHESAQPLLDTRRVPIPCITHNDLLSLPYDAQPFASCLL